MALGMYLLSMLHGCTGETKKSSGANHSEQKEVTEVFSGNFETCEIHVDKNGMDIYGVIHIPTGIEEKMPAIILSHELGATLDRVKGYGEALAKAGYVTCCFDFCGGGRNSRSDGEMLDMSVLTEKADLEAVLNEVKKLDFVDTDSIYLMGNSQGGLVTAMTASEHKDEIRAIILIYPAFSIYDDVHEMFDSEEEIPDTHYLLGLRLGQIYFKDIWDREPYGIVREYGKTFCLYMATGTLLFLSNTQTNSPKRLIT